MRSIIKLSCEFGPLIIFFIAYKYFGLIQATISIMIAITICSAITYFLEKKLSYITLSTLAIVMIMGGITIYSGDSKFIKMKPTIINIIFFLILFGGTILNKGLLKYIFGQALKMADQNWIIFSRRWAFYFLFVALLNEFIWRNFSEELWVNFKVFGSMALTFIFLLTQLKFISTNKLEK